MYNVSLKNLLENQPHRLEWKSSDAHRELCGLKGKQESDCQNYIRVFARINDHKVMICGTNSYKPLCRYYKNYVDIMTNDVESTSNNANGSDSDTLADEFASADGSSKEVYRLINEIDGQGRCQYNPVHNSSYIFTGNCEKRPYFWNATNCFIRYYCERFWHFSHILNLLD